MNKCENSTLIDAINLGVKSGNRWLIRGVNLRVNRGEIVTIIGPNGAGKSTTTKAMLGITPYDEGQVLPAPTLSIGYVPQSINIDHSLPLRVRRFVDLPIRHDTRTTDASLERVDALHLANARMTDLSGGELQRVLIARSISNKPDLLVLDEPVQGVDYSGEVALYQLIADLRDELHCGILLISHDLHIVMAKTDKVVCLNGHICCEGPPGKVIADPQFKAIFAGSSTHAIYQHHHDHVHTDDGHIVND